jgi:hypothetical protein
MKTGRTKKMVVWGLPITMYFLPLKESENSSLAKSALAVEALANNR